MQSPRPKYQVFVSSTYADLHEERERVIWGVLNARHIPTGMENLTAATNRGWEIICRVINLTDYYVVILAGMYGGIDNATGISWTQREYEYAVSMGIPVLCFIRDDRHITQDKLEQDLAKRDKLAAFKRILRDKHLVQVWTDAEDLARKVVEALRNHILDDEEANKHQPGWYRGNQLPPTVADQEFVHLAAENRALRAELNALKAFTLFEPGKFSEFERSILQALRDAGIEPVHLVEPVDTFLIEKIAATPLLYLAVKDLLNYLENYAAAVRNGVIDQEIAYERMHAVVGRWYRVFAPLIAHLRKLSWQKPTIWEQLELVADQWGKRYEMENKSRIA